MDCVRLVQGVAHMAHYFPQDQLVPMPNAPWAMMEADAKKIGVFTWDEAYRSMGIFLCVSHTPFRKFLTSSQHEYFIKMTWLGHFPVMVFAHQ